jgi:hypothetical protein
MSSFFTPYTFTKHNSKLEEERTESSHNTAEEATLEKQEKMSSNYPKQLPPYITQLAVQGINITNSSDSCSSPSKGKSSPHTPTSSSPASPPPSSHPHSKPHTAASSPSAIRTTFTTNFHQHEAQYMSQYTDKQVGIPPEVRDAQAQETSKSMFFKAHEAAERIHDARMKMRGNFKEEKAAMPGGGSSSARAKTRGGKHRGAGGLGRFLGDED